MADPHAATTTQLKNIQAKTGKTIGELHAAVAASGSVKYGERRAWLMEQFGLGYGDANAVVHFIDKPLPESVGGVPAASVAVMDGNALDVIYAGSRAGLRPLHEAVMAVARGFGPFEEAPKKTYISLRRKKQFAMVGPATKDTLEIGLNIKTLTPHARLKLQPPGGMCSATTRISSEAELDAVITGWLRQAFDAAG